MYIKIDPTMFAGNYIREAEPKRLPSKSRPKGQLRRYVVLECLHCHKHFEVSLANAKRTKQECCSHKCAKLKNQTFEGGNENHPLYSRWLSMKQRINNPNNNNYHLYGGRGIKIAEDLLDFAEYVRYLESLPDAPKSYPTDLTIDRIDTNADYMKGNLRWASASLQLVNQRKQPSSSKFIGVCYDSKREMWEASVTYQQERLFRGMYKTQEEALQARNDYIMSSGVPHAIQSQ